MNAIQRYGIEVGQIYIAADGSKCGHLVTDTITYSHVDDVVTMPFTPNGFDPDGYRIDAFKLAMVRYELVDEGPDWMPSIGKLNLLN